MSTAILTGLLISLRGVKKTNIDQEIILDFAIWAIPAAIFGARLYYVLFSFKTYQNNISQIFAIRQGGLAIHGAILGGLLVLILLTKRRKVSFWKVVDILAPGVIFGQAIGRWGNFINQEAFGGIVSKAYISNFPAFIQKQMYINGAYRHPTFLYESIWNIFIFIILLNLRKRNNLITGDIFLVYAIGYSFGRFFIEGMRTDSLMLGPLRIAQVISALVIISGVLLIYYRHSNKLT